MFDTLLTGRDPATGQGYWWPARTIHWPPQLEAATASATSSLTRSVRGGPSAPQSSYGLVGLVRTVDLGARRHRYGAGHVPRGDSAGELGALFAEPTGDCDPLWIDHDGHVFAAGRATWTGRPSLSGAARWTGAPLTWRNFSRPVPKLRAVGRRAFESARLLAFPPRSNGQLREPAGYLLRSPTNRGSAPCRGAPRDGRSTAQHGRFRGSPPRVCGYGADRASRGPSPGHRQARSGCGRSTLGGSLRVGAVGHMTQSSEEALTALRVAIEHFARAAPTPSPPSTSARWPQHTADAHPRRATLARSTASSRATCLAAGCSSSGPARTTTRPRSRPVAPGRWWATDVGGARSGASRDVRPRALQ